MNTHQQNPSDTDQALESLPDPQYDQKEFKEKPSRNPTSIFFPKLSISLLLLPFNYIQVNKILNNSTSIPLQISQTIASKGLSGFYRGYGSLLLSRIFHHITFSSTSVFLMKFVFLHTKDKNTFEQFFWINATSFFNGFIAGLCTSPIEAILVRNQTVSDSQVANKEYSGFFSAYKAIQAENQLSGLFRGSLAFAVFKGFGNVFWGLWSFVFYIQNRSEEGKFNATLATCVSLGAVYPLEYVRVQLQSLGSGLSYKQVFSETWKKSGVSGFYAGFGVYCMQRAIHSYFMYSVLLSPSQ